MKLPGQEEFDISSTCENVATGEPESGPGSGLSPDGPSDTDSRELGVPKDPVLFIQLNELMGWPQALEWRETGRWVLFEEKLEVGAGRWSAPHVPTLALPSLQKLRSLLAEGLVLLDCPARSLLELVEQVTRVELLSPELRGQLQALLLQRPQHLIWTTRTRPCCCERPLPGPPNSWVGEYQISPAPSWTRIGLASAQTSTGTHGQGKQRLASQLREFKGSSARRRAPAEDRHSHRPHPPSPELRRTGRLFGGFVQDVRRKASWYPSDFLDALHPQCFSAVLYIYLATVTNAITFGGLLGEATNGAQGVLESFLGTAVAGAAFCLMAGQPLTILSSTGPVLVFERLLFSFSRDYSLDYLPFRLWVGIWVAIFCLALVATEASVLVRYFTRFTEEGFCALISLIFIYDAVGKMLSLTRAYPIQRPGSPTYGCFCQFPDPQGNESQWTRTKPKDRDDILSVDLGLVNASLLPPPECAQQGGRPRGPGCHTVPDIAFFSVLLFLTSFLFAMALKHVKSSRFFPSVMRKMLSDFSSVLAILLGCGLDAFLGLATPKLMVPREFKPTLPGRGWLVSPFGANPWWLSVAAALPALLLSILIFMDQQITAVILNRAKYRLQKGAGFHLDLFCVAVLMLLTSALGLPWYVSATVISLAHMDSLRRESRACAPGEPPSFLGIREQRLTGLVVFILTGISIFLAPVLKFIPMPVLYGIFLYMGVAAISSIQFTKRVQLLLMPAKYQPDLLLLQHVPLNRIHLFTGIQLACLGLLWIIKSTPAAIIFPLMLLGLVGVRTAMEWVFSPQELLWLDELMPEKERNISEKGLEPEYSFSGSDSEDSELMYQPKSPEINISVN
nr:anion exchange protein 4 isoform X7 [Equus asinus]